jgi:hypothetical protein
MPRKKRTKVKQSTSHEELLELIRSRNETPEMTPEERRALNRETFNYRNMGRTWIQGLSATYMDVYKRNAAEMYRCNEDGCATLWRWEYRKKHGLPVGPEPKRSDDPDLVGNFARMRGV